MFDSITKTMDIFNIVLYVMIGIFIIMFVTVIALVIKRSTKNIKAPQLTVNAKVVSKRMNIHRNMTRNDTGFNDMTSTSYYVTFEVESGDRMELQVDGSESGLLVEGDIGKLTFKGTRYISFERTIQRDGIEA